MAGNYAANAMELWHFEGAAWTVAHSVLVSAATRERAGDRYGWRAFEPMSVRGKAEPLALFAPTGRLG